jgi:hypothetical protein
VYRLRARRQSTSGGGGGGGFAITNVSGTLSHGQAVTLTGAQFGTKSTAAPQRFDNFEDGTLNGNVADSANWGEFTNNPAGQPIYSNGQLRTNSTRSARARFNGDGASGTSSFTFGLSPRSNTLYFDYWQYMDGTTPNNQKTWRMFGSGGLFPETTWNIGGGSDRRLTTEGNSVLYENEDTGEGVFAGAWRHYQFWMVNSSANTFDGRCWMVRDCVAYIDKTDWKWRGTETDTDSGFWGIYTGYYCQIPAGQAAASCYFDDVYIDSYVQRVELGDNATYGSCTHREIQPPTAWADGEITVTLNTGTFSAGTAYLFVVDDTNTATAGFAVTLV